MSRDKQIEEIKTIIDKAEEDYSEIWNEWFYDHKEGTKIDNEFLFFAKAIYNAGYRKDSDVAREIFEEIEKLIKRNAFKGFSSFQYDLAELKKKYTESENNDG